MTDNVFSLLDEHWIPVSYLDGHPAEISLREIPINKNTFKTIVFNQLRNEGNHYVHGHSLHSAGSAEQHQPR